MKLCKNLRFFITLALVCCVANWTPEIENNIKDYISNELPSVYGVCFKFGQIEKLFDDEIHVIINEEEFDNFTNIKICRAKFKILQHDTDYSESENFDLLEMACTKVVNITTNPLFNDLNTIPIKQDEEQNCSAKISDESERADDTWKFAFNGVEEFKFEIGDIIFTNMSRYSDEFGSLMYFMYYAAYNLNSDYRRTPLIRCLAKVIRNSSNLTVENSACIT